MDGIQDLGQRMVEAARLAVAMHLYESAARTTPATAAATDAGAGLGAARQLLRRHVRIGGADPRNAGTSARLGDLVTDDERDGLVGRGDDQDANHDRDPSR